MSNPNSKAKHAHDCKDGHICNHLTNMDMHAFVKFGNAKRQGAGAKKSDNPLEYHSLVASEGDLKAGFVNRLPQGMSKFMLIFEFTGIPEKDVAGVKIVPGSRYGIAHHIEFVKLEKTYEARVHYDFSHLPANDVIRAMTDIDPNVHHPGGG